MKKHWLPLALAALLGAHSAGQALAVNSGLYTAPIGGDSLAGYHVYDGTGTQTIGFSIDETSDPTMTPNPIWSFGFSPATTNNNNDFCLFSHTYNTGGTGTNSTTGINNGYFLRMRGDNGQMTIGNDTSGALNHPGSTTQVKIWAGTSTQWRDGLGIACWGNTNGILMDQQQSGILRTKVNFANIFQVGTDSGLNGTADWYLKDSYNGKNTFPIAVGQDDKVVMNYGTTINGTATLNGTAAILGSATVGGSSSAVGFYGGAGVTKQTITGSWSDGTALASMITALKNLGLVDDQTTP